MNVAIVMPAYNEEGSLPRVIGPWLDLLRRVPGCLIVVNDGSTDGTKEFLERLALSEMNLHVFEQPNEGHGSAVMRGYREALRLGATHVFQTDSDDQFLISDFWKLWRRIDEAGFLLGVREKRDDSLLRIAISRVNRTLIQLLFRVTIQDANVPFRLMRGDILKDLLPAVPPSVFAPNISLSILAVRRGITMIEVPIEHRARSSGKGSLKRFGLLKVCLRSALDLLTLRKSITEASPLFLSPSHAN